MIRDIGDIQTDLTNGDFENFKSLYDDLCLNPQKYSHRINIVFPFNCDILTIAIRCGCSNINIYKYILTRDS